MIQDFYKLKAKKVEKETNDCVHITFEVPDELKHKFVYKQGQYVNLLFDIDGEEYRRSYSLVNAPSERNQDIEILVKRLEDGVVSTHLNTNLSEGDIVQVQPPMGHFYASCHPTNEKTYVGLAAGSGISPVLSNLVEVLYQEEKSKAYLIFSNRDTQNIIFRERIDALEKQFEGRLKVVYLLSREKHFENELFEGRISPEKLDELLAHFEIPVKEASFFICGPSEMIKTISTYLKSERKVPSLQVMYEYFAAPDDEDNGEMSEEFKKIPNLESMVTVIVDDDEYDFHLNSKKENILDKALMEQVPVPFACKGGVCCTCKAQVLEGEVFMEKNFALTEEEVEKGFVLSCQCHPTTNVVMLNFDV
ncbi:MAG: phenylacetate-CoA oxygenase [Flavobacteriales bacterium]|nr:MAG: phenylacetate-CoA oxygenase [Flavobacteriales bacterium]